MAKITKGKLFKEGVEYVIIDNTVYFSIKSVKEKILDVNLDFYNIKIILGKECVKFKDIKAYTNFGRNIRLSLSFKNHAKYISAIESR
ncbi:hypothetical protein [Flavobacterium terrigena]|uniref:Uncharacterized protein n=1 Tax=Flavobacterium terrigena TaxID=402734 RepID=A0A1H6SA03_9FLAO|nr:hypothetical protein [Flavobacterium terrigena]SEI60262.1 hypothetical protein SAMN05660918_1100 [Flavobacterium terrigena]